MNLNIDTSNDSLSDVLNIVGAAYGVNLTAAAEPTDTKSSDAADPAPSPVHTRRARTPKLSSRPDPAAVRAWALEHGMQVSNRGALPKTVVDAFRAAQ